MFYAGDLQSGIALALQESKVVACFIKGRFSAAQLQQPSLHFTDWLDSREGRYKLVVGGGLPQR